MQVQWEFLNGDQYEKYPNEINILIEKAYLSKDSFAEWGEKNDKGAKVMYRIDFKTMKDYEVGSKGSEVPVRRNNLSGKGNKLDNNQIKLTLVSHCPK